MPLDYPLVLEKRVSTKQNYQSDLLNSACFIPLYNFPTFRLSHLFNINYFLDPPIY